jgi:hypothetical protein
MRRLAAIALFCITTGSVFGQQIPSGTLLPAMLDKTIESGKTKSGEEITATLRQDVPLPDNGKIKRGSKILGHVVAVTKPAGSKQAKITVQFDRIEIDKQQVAISTGLRAFASMQLVAQARNPQNMNVAPGTSAWDLNIGLIGGQIAFNGQKIVKAPNGMVVGKVPEPGATLGVPMANPERGCAGPTGDTEQAFWIFSTDACGIYDDQGMTYVSGVGGNDPGKIVLESPKNFTVRSGSGWLLQVN